MMRIGQGYDVHRLVKDRPLILGGVVIDYELGLLGHSDADVLVHALCDACLGALGQGDIGRHFPDSDSRYAGIDSRELLRRVVALMVRQGYQLANLDATLICQRPKLASYLPRMVDNLAADWRCGAERINLKATTTEQLGFTGRGEGIAAQAVVLLERDEQGLAARRATLMS